MHLTCTWMNVIAAAGAGACAAAAGAGACAAAAACDLMR